MAQIKILFLINNVELTEQINETIRNHDIKYDYQIVNDVINLTKNINLFKPDIILANSNLIQVNELKSIKIVNTENETPIIIVSHNNSNKEGLDFVEHGAFDYVKSSDIIKIGIVINSALKHSNLKSQIVKSSQLIESYELANNVLNEITDEAILKIDSGGLIIDANVSASRFSGFTKKELISRSISELIVNGQLTVMVILENKLRKANTVKSEQNFIAKSGRIIHIELNIRWINNDTCFCCITKLAAGNKLLKSKKITQHHLLDIVEHSANLFYAHDTKGNFTYVSPKTKELFDCIPEEFNKLTSNIFTVHPINIIGKRKTQIAIETGEAQAPFELELIGKKGRKVWVEVNEVPIVRNGKISGIVGALIDITESKRTSDKLIQSERKFRTLFTKAPDGILLCDDIGNIIDCNNAFCKIVKIKKEEITHTNFSNYLYSEKHNDLKINADTFSKTSKIDKELLLLTDKNEILNTRCGASALNNGKGSFTGAIVHIYDISDHKKNQKELIERESRLSAIFNAADNISFILTSFSKDDSSSIIEFSTGSENIFGFNKTEILGKSINQLYTAETISDYPVFIEKMKHGEQGFKGRINMIRKSGNEFIALHTIYPIFDSSQKLNQVLAVSIDLTSVEEIENTLKKREEQLSTLINSSPDIICFKDCNSRWQMANSAILRLFCLEEIDYVGKTNSEIAQQSNSYSNYLLKCNSTDESAWSTKQTIINEETVPVASDKFIKFEIIKVPIFHPNGDRKALVILGRDITRRKQLETQLHHSQKMEAIGLMASGIAHNFNNILQAIVGYIDFAKDGLDEKTQRYADIDQIDLHVKRATMLTKNLLAVGKDQFMKKTEIDVNDIIWPIVELTNRYKKNNIVVDFNEMKNMPIIIADGSQIDQVIMNLFINARDAMPNGGKISVVTCQVNINIDFCSLNPWAKPGNYIKISISDTGHGMDNATKARIFEPYFTTKDLDKGTGLGLSTAFGIISQHKGILNVISECKKGTTFEIFLPLR
jgi:two-component system, cell cycle sensor histidine kinase and response regulator CckA